jgi:hypothetical protein
MEIEFEDGKTERFPDSALPADLSTHVFERSGRLRKVTVTMKADTLFGD